MSATLLSELSVSQARRRLSDTSRMSPEQVNALEQVVAKFHASRPKRGQQCVACGSAVWSEHTATDGEPVWCCSSCHRSASLTAEEWHAQRAEKAAKDAEAQARIAATGVS